MGEKIQPEQIVQTRGLYIEERYTVLFGPEEMGDPTREFTPSELTGILADYEKFLIKEGVIDIQKPPRPTSSLGRLGTSGHFRSIPKTEKET